MPPEATVVEGAVAYFSVQPLQSNSATVVGFVAVAAAMAEFLAQPSKANSTTVADSAAMTVAVAVACSTMVIGFLPQAPVVGFSPQVPSVNPLAVAVAGFVAVAAAMAEFLAQPSKANSTTVAGSARRVADFSTQSAMGDC
ncbi:MAG: hypothetical protein LBP65_01535 [Puniceicoccales bacterium]|jgi:hypothetical protein|nr:hypothetical protein [Puniceicoccales bacterium]